LETLDAEFKIHHFSVIDLIEDETVLDRQQQYLDDHDDILSDLSIRIRKRISSCATSKSADPDLYKRRLNTLQKNLISVGEKVEEMSSSPENLCRLKQHEEQLMDYKKS
jgi:hypothetical protein